jgi:predicted transcriptional regulator
MSEKKVFSTRIDDDLLKKLKHLAVDEEQSIGALLEKAIRDFLQRHETEKNKKK